MAIRLDSPGPTLFRQRRIGFANNGFEMLKFRTMHDHEPERGRFQQTTRHDPRVTRVGAIMRRMSFDELPQLINVLRGEMSIVGPRPHAPGTCAGDKPFELVTPHYAARHRVLPGMTGLAQIRGLRGETDTEEKLLRRLESDLEYIDTWSLWLDFAIMARTAVSGPAMRNAY
jgi:lipopolysaccharide/colanic/teichoic acid biosynthesis glycosyltransferase